MLFVLSFLLSLDIAVKFEINKVWSKIMLGYRLIVFKNWYVFTVRLFWHFPLFFLSHVDFLRMK